MDKLFGEVDAVAAGEEDISTVKRENMTYDLSNIENTEAEKGVAAAHIEGTQPQELRWHR